MKLETITLEKMLPEVFASESIPSGDVWQQDLIFHRGETYLVAAESGAGKSSLCAYLYGARTDFRGKLLFNGISTSTLRMENWQELRRQNIAYLPQELSLFPELTALENVRLKNRMTGNFT